MTGDSGIVRRPALVLGPTASPSRSWRRTRGRDDVEAARTDYGDEPAKAMIRAELSRVLDEVDPRWRLFFEFLAHTGLRISEAIELRWRDLDVSLVPRLLPTLDRRVGTDVG